MNGTITRALDFLTRVLASRHVPVILAIGAVLVMLPALKLGLIADDLPQRMVEFRPEQLPPRLRETGILPSDSGSFSTVLFDLFGFSRDRQDMASMKHYGALPWWTPDDLKLSLCLPIAALTHWFDYRLFPNSPVLMHAHNIAWFAGVIFMVAVVYRKLMGTGWAAGLAALLFLLDSNTYFPAAFVANRGYFLALFFSLLCLYEHHQWRSTKSLSAMLLSGLFLVLSVFSEESGASAFAFILAYGLVLEPGSFRDRTLTVLPSVTVITAWQVIYIFSGYGLRHVGIYTGPSHEPLHFLRDLVPRDLLLLGSQLTGVPAEILFAFKPSLHPIVIVAYGTSVVAALAVFLPLILRDKVTAFWFWAMILAAVPEAVLVPWTKNFGYIAIASFGLIASFVGGLFNRSSHLPERAGYRSIAWIACVLLILVHGPGAIAKRVAVTKVGAAAFHWAGGAPPNWPNIENEDVIVINHPLSIAALYVPAYATYFRQQFPRTLRVLAPSCTGFDVRRTDDKTLVLRSHGSNIFSCDDLGPAHIAYAFNAVDGLLGNFKCKNGERYNVGNVNVEILESDATGLPSCVAFHFDASLDSPRFRWLSFNWRASSSQPFKIPAVGQSVTISGP